MPLRRIARRALYAFTLASLLVTGCAPGFGTAPAIAPPPGVRAPVVVAPPAIVSPPPAAPAPAVEPTPVAPAAPVAQAAPAPVSAGLQAVLDAVDARHPGRVGVVVRHLESGETASLNARGQFRAASLYKLFVMHSAFARMRAGEMSKGETLTFGKAAYDREPYAEWPVGTRTTASCALQAMITISHNAASAMLIDRLGGENRITDEMFKLGMEWTTVTSERAYTSPGDVATLLEKIWRGQAVDPAASQAMLALLSAQQRNDRLPLPLPADVVVAHKTGELAKLRHDAGIVFAPSGPYVMVAMVQDAPSDAAARAAAVDVSRAVYAYFEGSAPSFKGMAPRLAQEVLQTPNAQGRLAPLPDPWAQTLPLGRSGVKVAEGAKDATLRDVAVPDLVALQKAATAAGADFWVTAGHRAPTGAEASKAVPSTTLTCDYQLPPKPAPTAAPRSADDADPAKGAPRPTAGAGTPSSAANAAGTPKPPASAAASAPKPYANAGAGAGAPKAPAALQPPAEGAAAQPAATPKPVSPTASQHWLGTVVAVADSPAGERTADAEASSPTADWLLENAWRYGFVPALPESAAGAPLGYEPSTLRWVGRELAADLHARATGDPAGMAAELRVVAREVARAA